MPNPDTSDHAVQVGLHNICSNTNPADKLISKYILMECYRHDVIAVLSEQLGRLDAQVKQYRDVILWLKDSAGTSSDPLAIDFWKAIDRAGRVLFDALLVIRESARVGLAKARDEHTARQLPSEGENHVDGRGRTGGESPNRQESQRGSERTDNAGDGRQAGLSTPALPGGESREGRRMVRGSNGGDAARGASTGGGPGPVPSRSHHKKPRQGGR